MARTRPRVAEGSRERLVRAGCLRDHGRDCHNHGANLGAGWPPAAAVAPRTGCPGVETSGVGPEIQHPATSEPVLAPENMTKKEYN